MKSEQITPWRALLSLSLYCWRNSKKETLGANSYCLLTRGLYFFLLSFSQTCLHAASLSKLLHPQTIKYVNNATFLGSHHWISKDRPQVWCEAGWMFWRSFNVTRSHFYSLSNFLNKLRAWVSPCSHGLNCNWHHNLFLGQFMVFFNCHFLCFFCCLASLF